MSLRRTSTTAILASFCFLVTLGSPQGNQSELLKVELSVARYVKSLGLKGNIGFDESAQPSTVQSSIRPAYRSVQHAASLATEMGAQSVKLDEVVSCSAPRDPRSCKMNGVIQVLRIGVPEIKGDSATIWLYSQDGREGGLTPVSQSDKLLLFVRDGNSWRFAKIVSFRET